MAPAANCIGSMEKEYLLFLLRNRETELALVNDELEAYESILRWVGLGDGARAGYFEELFSILNLVKIPESILRSDIAAETLVGQNALCMFKVEESLRKRKELYEVICVIRRKDQLKPMLQNEWDLIVYSPRLEKWKTIWVDRTLPSTFFLREAASALVTIGRHFYILTSKTLHILEYQDTGASWQTVAEDYRSSYGFKTVATNDCLFVVQSTTIGEYNIMKKQWRTIHVSVERDNFTAVAVGKYIYVLGGTDFEDMLSATVQRYDTESENLLSSLRDMRQPRCDAAAAHFDGKIFVMGGYNFMTDDILKSVEVYNISADSWTVLPDMQFPRVDHTAFIVDGQLYAVGGDTNSPNTMELFDEEEQAWKIEVIPEAVGIYATRGHLPYELLC